jgi:formate dehydrogenase (NADP+) beta subunit
MIKVNPDTLATNLKGVFAGGDVIPGQAWVIRAIADGRKAAISVDEYLGGDGRFAEDSVLPEESISTKTLPQVPLSYSDRVSIPLTPMTEGINSFTEVENTLLEGAGIEEAKRCLWCDLEPWIKDLNKCALCSSCQFRCSLIYTGSFNQNLSGITISEMKPADKKIIFNDNCIGCSICARYCTYDAIELKRKVEG